MELAGCEGAVPCGVALGLEGVRGPTGWARCKSKQSHGKTRSIAGLLKHALFSGSIARKFFGQRNKDVMGGPLVPARLPEHGQGRGPGVPCPLSVPTGPASLLMAGPCDQPAGSFACSESSCPLCKLRMTTVTLAMLAQCED